MVTLLVTTFALAGDRLFHSNDLAVALFGGHALDDHIVMYSIQWKTFTMSFGLGSCTWA